MENLDADRLAAVERQIIRIKSKIRKGRGGDDDKHLLEALKEAATEIRKREAARKLTT